MSLDIRIPIGLMFVIVGAIILVYGLVTFTNVQLYEKSLGININLWTGAASLVFGGFMLSLAWLAAQRDKKKPKV
jgi:hypothetical protein